MAGVNFPRRGDVYWVDLDPTVGTEIAKTRPCVVISNDTGNEYSARVIIAAITSGNTTNTTLVFANKGAIGRALVG